MGYMQQVECDLNAFRLYPYRGELDQHVVDLELTEKGLAGYNLDEEGGLTVMREVLQFSKPLFKDAFQRLLQMEHAVQDFIHLELIGIQPIFWSAGYIMIDKCGSFSAYRYQLSEIVTRNVQSLVQYEYVDEFDLGSPEKTRYALIEKEGISGSPATFLANFDNLELPVEETILPVCGRMIYQYVNGKK